MKTSLISLHIQNGDIWRIHSKSPDSRYVELWYHYRGIITDIIKTGRQVKKILNLIFRKLFKPIRTLIGEWIF